MRVAGVDDSGRGPVIGPLVIAGVLVDEEGLKKLKAIRGKESKGLTPRQRERMSLFIKEVVIDHTFVEIPPAEIDRYVREKRRLHKLNRLEAKAMAEAICKLKPDVAYVDASDVNAKRYGEWVKECLPIDVRIVSKHKADITHAIVGAASILAKVRRDEITRELHGNYGFFGSGYPTDPRTRQFLTKWFEEHGSFPPIVRKSWKTLERIKKSVR